MDEKQISGQESLLIIQQMIDTAKKEQKDDGMGWILWGWLLFLASVFTYINLYTRWVSVFFFWTAFGIVSLLIGLFEVVRVSFFRKKEKETAGTHLYRRYSRLCMAGICGLHVPDGFFVWSSVGR